MFLKRDIWLLVHIIICIFIVRFIYGDEDPENAYNKKYLDSFPVSEKDQSNTHFHNNFLMPDEMRKYKKVRKKLSSENEMNDDQNQYADEEKFYIAFTKNPFGPSSPLSRSEVLGFNLNISDNLRHTEVRDKRGVAQLYNMVSCATGCNPISYKGYGCYCGFLGSGHATDSIDRCCKHHDLCYNTVNCPLFLEYFMPYLWKCWRGQPLCAVDHLDYGGPNSCAARLCECDRQLAVCLSYSPCPHRRALCRSSPWRLLQNILMF